MSQTRLFQNCNEKSNKTSFNKKYIIHIQCTLKSCVYEIEKKNGHGKIFTSIVSYTRELQHIHEIPNNSKISKLQNMVFACHLEWCIQNACQLACTDSGSSSLRTGFHNQAHLFWSRQSWLHIPKRKRRHYSRTSHLIVAIHLKTNLFCPPQTKLPTATSLKIFGVQKAFA